MKINKPTKMKLPRIKHPKRLIIIVASVIVALGLIAYGVFSYLTWRGLDEHSKTAASDLKTAIDTSLGAEKPSGTPSEQIDTLVTNFNKKYGTQPCAVSPLFGWQRFIPAVKDISNSCDQRFASAVTIIDALKPVSQFLKDEKTIANLLTTTLTATAALKDYAATSATWKAVADSTSLPTSANIKSVTDKIKAIAGAMSTSYDKLVAASAKEDKVALDLAISELQAAYASVAELAATSNTQRDSLIAKVTEAYEKL